MQAPPVPNLITTVTSNFSQKLSNGTPFHQLSTSNMPPLSSQTPIRQSVISWNHWYVCCYIDSVYSYHSHPHYDYNSLLSFPDLLAVHWFSHRFYRQSWNETTGVYTTSAHSLFSRWCIFTIKFHVSLLRIRVSLLSKFPRWYIAISMRVSKGPTHLLLQVNEPHPLYIVATSVTSQDCIPYNNIIRTAPRTSDHTWTP